MNRSITRIKLHITKLNHIFAFIIKALYSFNSPLYVLQAQWTKKDSGFRDELISINTSYQTRIKPEDIPKDITKFKDSHFSKLKIYVAALRNTLQAVRITKENIIKTERIKFYENLRCTNFAEHKAAFIASALNRSKRCIVLDRAMGLNEEGAEILLTEPSLVKSAAINHFKTIAGSPPPTTFTVDNIPSNWSDIYQPMEDVDQRIYTHLMDSVTYEEWNTILTSLPSNKAPGRSGIPYEMLKNLPVSGHTYLKNLISECMHTSFVPSA